MKIFKICSVTLTVISLCFGSIVNAQPTPDLSETIPQPAAPSMDMGPIEHLIAGFGVKETDAMAKLPGDIKESIPLDVAQGYSYQLDNLAPLIGPLTQKLLNASIAPNKKENSAAILTDCLNSDEESCVKNKTFANNPLASVDINSLIGPVVYATDDQRDQAKRVIQALSGALVPMPTLDLGQKITQPGGKQAATIQLNDAKVKEYLSGLRAYLTIQSLALSNLYFLYAERLPINKNQLDKNQFANLSPDVRTALGTKLGSISPLKLEQTMATRRMTDEKWHTNLSQDNPAALQRQQVQLLSEILAETYQLRVTSERILATMSILTMQLSQTMRGQLQGQLSTITNPPDTTEEPEVPPEGQTD
jgi:hypothetical protein